MNAFIQGFLVCGGLIVAIGAQNAYVLKQGLLKQNILAIILTCFACDFVLISLAVIGLGSFISQSPSFTLALTLFGALFLFIYGIKAFLSAYRGNNSLQLSQTSQCTTTIKSVLNTLAITLLNPHVYLDCFAIIGSIASTLDPLQKWGFLWGALTTSLLWFVSLGYGSRLLIPLFQRPITWRVLDCLIGIIMWLIAFSLLRFALRFL
ncbi:MAG: LysE/ArgO family amino acid transporter [Pasteurellaceae bacterium]|nr:LysE/ArgO family amino acid transporter [Pasteurellaceae bacterium]